MVSGLTSNDFKVYEDGAPQQLKYFTADAFPLSAAVVVATDLPATTMKKVNETLPALIAAFSEFDEVALFRYGHTVQQVSGFTAAPSVSTASMNRIKRPGARAARPCWVDLSEAGPTINGHPVNDPNAGPVGDVQTAPREFYVLNDAILRAAQDLSRATRPAAASSSSSAMDANWAAPPATTRSRRSCSPTISAFMALAWTPPQFPIYDKMAAFASPALGRRTSCPVTFQKRQAI